MTPSAKLREIAAMIRRESPEAAMCLNQVAAEVRRMEVALDEIVDDARESAELAERVAREGIKRTGAGT